MASVRVSFPPDLEGMLRSEIWNYKTDPPHNGAGFSFCSGKLEHISEIASLIFISVSICGFSHSKDLKLLFDARLPF